MNDGYKELAAAIVERAVLDYRAALMNQDKYGRISLESSSVPAGLMSFRIVKGKYLCR